MELSDEFGEYEYWLNFLDMTMIFYSFKLC